MYNKNNIYKYDVFHSLIFTSSFTEEDLHQSIMQTEEELRNLI